MDSFWSKVDVQGPDGCWEWTACRLPKGYGRIAWKGSWYLASPVLVPT